MKIYKLVIFLLLAVSCQIGENANSIDSYRVINNISSIELDFDKIDSIKASEFIKSFSYIVLPDNDAFIGTIDNFSILDSLFFITDKKTNAIYIYSLSGELINIIKNVGRGPGEYYYIHKSWINKDKKQIEIYDRNSNKILIYNIDGTFLREFSSPGYVSSFCSKNAYRYYYRDKDGFYDDKGNSSNIHLLVTGDSSDNIRTYIQSSHFINDVYNSVNFAEDDKSILFIMAQNDFIYLLDGMQIKELYHLKFKPTPLYDFPKYKDAKSYNEIKKISTSCIGCIGNLNHWFASNKYIFFSFGKQREADVFTLGYVIYNRNDESIKFMYNAIYNDIDSLNNWLHSPIYISDNMFIFVIYPYQLSSTQKILLSKFSDIDVLNNDNPILVLAKLKI